MVDKLNQILRGLLKNPVVETVLDTEWSTIRYADGTFEATRRYTGAIAVTQESGSMYVSSVSEITLPSFVTDESQVTYCNVNIVSTGYPILSCIRNITDRVIRYMGVSTVSRPGTNYQIIAEIKGKISSGGDTVSE